GVVQNFRDGIGQAASADIVDADHGVGLTPGPARIDDLLAAALHLGVVTLHRGKIEFGAGDAGAHGRSRPAAQTDQHGRAAQHDHLIARLDSALLHVVAANVGDAAGDHDRFVVTTTHIGLAVFLLEGAEIAAQTRASEFVVEGGGAERAVAHDL